MRRHHAGASVPAVSKKLSDEACGRLMEIYVQEAEQYDKGLVQSWKDDMDVTLVFSGLYSAVLTAFVIESYQKLQEDPADASVVLLRQLVFLSNSSNIDINTEAPSDVFAPTSAALACNILWFMSLILALCCAFLATFVQQWSRQFIHKTGHLRSSTAHARLLSFLYFGLKNFRMHTVVNVIPSLLHLSLFSFLGGLIAFLRDVNPVLTYIVVVALALVTTIYISFTILPLIALNSPYQTPFSPVAWKMWQTFRRGALPIVRKEWQRFTRAVLPLAQSIFRRPQSIVSRALVYAPHAMILPILPTLRYPHYPVRPPSIWHKFTALLASISASTRLLVSSIYALCKILPHLPVVYEPHQSSTELPLEKVLENSSPEENLHDLSDEVLAASQKPDPQRDMQCTAWTLSSLTNDQELLPFIEALPDAIYGPKGIHDNNLHLIKPLVETTDPQADIILRIISLMSNASNSWFDENHRKRCSIACPKALWTLAFMFSERRDQFDLTTTSRELWFPHHLLEALDKGSRSATGNILDRKYTVSAGVLCAIDSQHTPYQAGSAVRRFLEASRELEPFEFERTSSALSMYLSLLSGDMIFEEDFTNSFACSLSSFADRTVVPQIDKGKPLPPEQRTRLDTLFGLCLHLPELCSDDITSLLEFIYKRAEMNGWGSTWALWGPSGSLRALDGCYIRRNFCNAMRECFYALLIMASPAGQRYENVLVTCVRTLAKHSTHTKDKNSDTSRIALETMIAIVAVLSNSPKEGAEVSKDFELVCQYVEQNVLHIGGQSWTWDDPRYGEDVQAGRIVVLMTRLLREFLQVMNNPAESNVILDTLEFIVFNCDIVLVFSRWHSYPPAVSQDLLVSFSQVTLDICQRWTESPSKSTSRNALDIIAWMWKIWQMLKFRQSKEATQNLAKAAKLMLSPESLRKVNECRSKKASRVPAPYSIIVSHLKDYSIQRFDFQEVLKSYTGLGSDDHPLHSQRSNPVPDMSNDAGDTAMADVEEGPDFYRQAANDCNDDSNPSSPIAQAPVSLPWLNDRWVV